MQAIMRKADDNPEKLVFKLLGFGLLFNAFMPRGRLRAPAEQSLSLTSVCIQSADRATLSPPIER